MKISILRCYDNGGADNGGTLDRYTILPPARAWRKYKRDDRGRRMEGWRAISCNSTPFHGIGYYCEAVAGPRLGKRVAFESLPPDVRKFAEQTFPEFVFGK